MASNAGHRDEPRRFLKRARLVPVPGWDAPFHRLGPPPRGASEFIQGIVAGERVHPPWDDDLLVANAFGSGDLDITAACLLRAALPALPPPVVRRILAFAIVARPHVTPYCGANPKVLGEQQRYTTLEELWGLRQPEARLTAINDHNSCFTAVSPYALCDGEEVYAEGSGMHKSGVGLVVEGNRQLGLRFNPLAFVHYQGISFMHGRDPEYEIRSVDEATKFAQEAPHGALWIGVFTDAETNRRYCRIRPHPEARGDGFVFWLPSVFNRTVPTTADDAGAPPRRVRVFPAIQIWNNGTGRFCGLHTRVAPENWPQPPPQSHVFTTADGTQA